MRQQSIRIWWQSAATECTYNWCQAFWLICRPDPYNIQCTYLVHRWLRPIWFFAALCRVLRESLSQCTCDCVRNRFAVACAPIVCRSVWDAFDPTIQPPWPCRCWKTSRPRSMCNSHDAHLRWSVFRLLGPQFPPVKINKINYVLFLYWCVFGVERDRNGTWER